MRILVYGAGVIGSVMAGFLCRNGNDVTVMARNKRYDELCRKGLLLRHKDSQRVLKCDVKIIDKLYNNDIYDYVIVTVRYEQIESVLTALKSNRSKNIVTMVNNPKGYGTWEKILGNGRLIPAFPGAGGKIVDGTAVYQIVSPIIQPTTIGELDGTISDRIKALKRALKKAGIPSTISRNMDCWQKSHLAMVIPFSNAYYFSGQNTYEVSKNKNIMDKTVLALKENFNFLKASDIGITPPKFNIFLYCPKPLLSFVLGIVFNTKWAETVMYNHCMNAVSEMALLNQAFITLAEQNGFDLSVTKEMSKNTFLV